MAAKYFGFLLLNTGGILFIEFHFDKSFHGYIEYEGCHSLAVLPVGPTQNNSNGTNILSPVVCNLLI